MYKSKITFKAHPDLLANMHQAVQLSNYGPRGKSKWISEALMELFNMDKYWEIVIEERPMAKLSDNPESLLISAELRDHLDNAIRLCSLKSPFKQGIQSSIIRSAIMQKLING